MPESIPRPDYADGTEPIEGNEPLVKTPETIARLRRAGAAAARVLAEVGAAIEVGVTTDELDRIAHAAYIAEGGYPSPLHYRGFPKSICTSINEVICHGIPDDRPLADGDIINVDVTIFLDGVHGDTSRTYGVGQVDAVSRSLIERTRECLEIGIDAVAPGRPILEIGTAIEGHATAHGLGVVRTFVGHGIGEEFHAAPSVPHYHEPRANEVMESGMVFTIEPMITMGAINERIWDDDWTAVTVDGARTAQFEQTIVVTADGAEILTEWV